MADDVISFLSTAALLPTGTDAPEASASDRSSITGTSPANVDNTTYGKTIVLFAGGHARLGCRIIFGPFIIEDGGKFFVDIGVSMGFASNPEGDRSLRDISADSTIIWDHVNGSLLDFLENSQIRFYGGTYNQSVDELVTKYFPDIGIAFRPQMVLFITKFPLEKFGNKVPFFAPLIGDITDGADPAAGIGLDFALQRIAYSPFLGFNTVTFAVVNVTDVVEAVLLGENIPFMEYLNRFASLYRNWIIRTPTSGDRAIGITFRLEIFDHGDVENADIILNRSHLIPKDGGPLTIVRQSEMGIPNKLSLKFIDPNQDYIFNVMNAQRPLEPFPVTSAIGTTTINLPIVTDASTAISLVTFAKYYQEISREKYSFTTLPIGYTISPSDIVQIDMDYGSHRMRVLETTHGADYTVQVTAEKFCNCRVAIIAGPPVTPPPAPTTLDAYTTGNTGAWSMSRKLFSLYSAHGGSFYHATGGGVDTLYDQSTNSRDFIGAFPSRYPTVATAGPKNLTCADFDGSSDYLQTAVGISDFFTATAGYMIITAMIDTVVLDSATAYLNDLLIGDSLQYMGIYLRNNGPHAYGYNFASSPGQWNNISFTENAVHIFEWKHESGIVSIIVDGVEVAIASGATQTVSGFLSLFGRGNQYANGKMFEAATWSVIPSSDERATIRQFFKTYAGAL